LTARVPTIKPLSVELAADTSVADDAIETLLHDVYVQGGFTVPEVASTLFRASAVRARGDLLVARDPTDGRLLGMVIVAGPEGPARKLARPGEAEMHLLAVAPAVRSRGLGRTLVDTAVEHAGARGFRRMVLWTQPGMHAAHRLYLAAGFERITRLDFETNGRSFLVFQRQV